MTDNITKIRTFIVENFLFGEDADTIENQTSFLEHGVIDSTGILELVEWLEEEFKISVGDDELIPENLDSVQLLAAYIARKKS